MIQAVIFDMDGILIDSSPFWKDAEKQVFSTIGIDITDELSELTVGMTTREATEFWLHYANLPLTSQSLDTLDNGVIDEVIACIQSQGQIMQGVYELLTVLKQQSLKIALATNAPARVVPVVLDKLQIGDFFDCYVSADDVSQGKPHPEIYQLALSRLAVAAPHAIAFEDSVTGMTAAQAAQITTVAVPCTTAFEHPGFDRADLKIKSLEQITLPALKSLVGC